MAAKARGTPVTRGPRVPAAAPPTPARPLTQLGLAAVRHLHQGVLLLIEQDLHPLHVAVHAFKSRGQALSPGPEPAAPASPHDPHPLSGLALPEGLLFCLWNLRLATGMLPGGLPSARSPTIQGRSIAKEPSLSMLPTRLTLRGHAGR